MLIPKKCEKVNFCVQMNALTTSISFGFNNYIP